MKQNERKIFIDMIERLIKAYDCGETQMPGDRCEHCPYGFGNHKADITVGDFHNINRYVKEINRFGLFLMRRMKKH